MALIDCDLAMPSLFSKVMEPGRVELPSALALSFPLVHRLSHDVPHGRVYSLT
jgi:hypothetical protein